MDIGSSRTTAVAAGIIGLAVGDALGVPVEFEPRRRLRGDPVTSMRSFGSHNQPAGTWSDDTSLTLCLTESLCECGIEYHDQARRFIGWLRRAEWTPHGEVFDVGNATRSAICRLDAGVEPTEAGLTGEFSNGNGSLMRILPIALYLAFAEREVRMEATMQCSRLTHGHPRCQIACALFVEVAAALVRGVEIAQAVADGQRAIGMIVDSDYPTELPNVRRLLNENIGSLPDSDVSGSGYAIDCLESSLWCSLRASSYREGVLEAVNLGDDTDTTGAVTGALVGLRFGVEAIPDGWRNQLARRDDIHALCERFQDTCERRWEIDR